MQSKHRFFAGKKRVLTAEALKNEKSGGAQIYKDMKKIILFLCAVLFLLGIAMNLQYAVNNYDFKTNSIHSVILAAETTGTGTSDDAFKSMYCGLVNKSRCDFSTTDDYVEWKAYISNQFYYDNQGYTCQTCCKNFCVPNVYFIKGNWSCCNNG